MAFGDLASAVEALTASPVSRRTGHVGNRAMAEIDKVLDDRLACLMVSASDLIGLLQRVDPAEPDDRNAGRRRSRNRLAIMGADEKQPGAGTGQIFQLPSAMRPVHAQTHAEPLGFALHAILDLHVELAVD